MSRNKTSGATRPERVPVTAADRTRVTAPDRTPVTEPDRTPVTAPDRALVTAPDRALVTAEDRLLASAFGVKAVDLLAAGKGDRMVSWWNRTVIDVPLAKVVGRSSTVDRDGTLILTARALGICLGDQA